MLGVVGRGWRRDHGLGMAHRIRCTECRQRVPASPTAGVRQKVCGESCRKLRNRKLARKRRRKNLEEARQDERDRKERSRKARKAGTTAQMPGLTQAREPASWTASRECHAPGSADNPAKVLAEIVRLMDKLRAMSRARFRRQLEQIGGKPAAQSSAPPARAGP